MVYPEDQSHLTVGKGMTCVSDQQILDAICGGEPIPPLNPPSQPVAHSNIFATLPAMSSFALSSNIATGTGFIAVAPFSPFPFNPALSVTAAAVTQSTTRTREVSANAPSSRSKKAKKDPDVAPLEGDFEPSKPFKPSNQAFRSDRATIHLYHAEHDQDEEDEYEVEPSIPRGDLARLRPFLRRGDLLENTAVSGYRSEGVSIYDGRRVTALSYEQDDYGCLGPEYVIYRDFNPHYWDYGTMNVNNLLAPEMENAQSQWHAGDYPCCYVDRHLIVQAEGLQVNLFGKVYDIPQEFKDWVMENAEVEGEVFHEEMRFVEGMDGVSIALI
jgi:hypothetical protein